MCSPCFCSEHSFPPCHPGQRGPLSSSKPRGTWAHSGSPRRENEAQREKWTKTRKEGQWLSCPLPTPQSPSDAWTHGCFRESGQRICPESGLERGNRAGPELFLPRCELPGSRARGLVLVSQSGTVHFTEQICPRVCWEKGNETVLNGSWRGEFHLSFAQPFIHSLLCVAHRNQVLLQAQVRQAFGGCSVY